MHTRRAFLAAAGATVLGCAAPAATPSRSPATSVPPSSLPSPGPTASPVDPPDWSALAAALRGTLVRPADAGYDRARLLYNTRFDGIRPQAIARCATADDVRACVDFARRSGMAIAPRSGGHSYGGWSSGPGLVVDVGPLRSVDVRAGTAVIGAGARLVDVYAALAAQGVGIPAGSCPTVGITGLTLGGGLGVLTRAWGLTCDDLASADIVTADGRLRTCDADREPDLYWALRGGGGGNFGIVTSLTLRTHRAAPLAIAFLGWPWSRATDVLRAWPDWIAQAPDALWSTVHLGAAEGAPSLLVHSTYLGDQAALSALLDRLVAMVGAAPTDRTVISRTYGDAMLLEGGCATAAPCHLRGDTPEGTLGRETYDAKSAVIPGPLSSAAIGEILSGIETLVALPNAGSGAVLLDALGGAVARVAPDATAFPHRAALAVAQLVGSWSADAPGPTAEATRAWLRGLYGRLRPLVGTGAYVNYIDPELGDWPQAYYGANYARLQRVKARYDADRLFAFPQAVTA